MEKTEASSIDRIRLWARAIKRDVLTLWIAARDKRTTMAARIAAACIAAYALSPIDLIPDFVPILGYLDDLLIVPVGIMLVMRLLPAPLLADYRGQAALIAAKPVSRVGLAVVIALWFLAALALVAWFTDII